ncbi:pentapeptide repeat-containing protein [Micromonospora sp. A200]|uniref:pentapeptide repeat-containing protein n=1 Tax=Micromonospora sp. A200 TaxID=2940568 RepID=UPI002473C94B|nr:pentapeptide repeat-containing protein [Micromonospora sp. A200]
MIESRHLPLSPKDRLDAEAAIRTSIVQLIGGAALLVGIYFTARNFRLTREGHITDRLTKAVEQLGHASIDVRLGGIFALERIARDSGSDRETVLEVLTAYVKQRTRLQDPDSHEAFPNTPSAEPVTQDVQAALSVLGRRPRPAEDKRRLDLYVCGLNHAKLTSSNFEGAMFYYSRLDYISLSSAKLDGAGLSFCTAKVAAFSYSSARYADFVHSKFVTSWFMGADLTGADFTGCDLSGSDFGRRYAEDGDPPGPPALLANADFTDATLTDTDFRGVDLSTVRGLTREQLDRAIKDDNTVLPSSWRDD